MTEYDGAATRTTELCGREVTRLAFGTMRLAGEPVIKVRECLEAAREAGIEVVDTAPIYGTGGPGYGDVEERLGRAWAGAPSLRDVFVLVTKAGITPGSPYDSSAHALTASCEASLRRMGTDSVDLFLIHRPDHLAGHAEVGRALDGLVASGKVRGVGVSNYTPSQVRALAAHMEAPLLVNQVEFSPLATAPLADGTLDQCEELGIVPMAWSPLGGGRLIPDETERTSREQAVRDALVSIARSADVGIDAAALAWSLAHPASIVPVLGTTSPARISAASEATRIGLSRPQWYAVLEACLGRAMP